MDKIKIPLAGILADENGELVSEPVMTFPLCQYPDGCKFAVCAWSGVPLCFPHAMQSLGVEEMRARYEATHDITWEEFQSGD